MAFEEYPCVKQILCTLGVPVLSALDGVITLVTVEINTQLAAVAGALAALDIILLPVNLAVSAAQAILDQFKSAFALVPVNLMEGCAKLGDLMGFLNDIADKATAALQDFLADATRLLSVRDELQALQDQLNNLIPDFTALKEVIAECISGG